MSVNKKSTGVAPKKVKFGATSYKQALFLNSESFFTVFGGAAMSGKAQPLDAKVLTSDGFVEMGSIKVGSKVTTPDNKEALVLATHHFDDKPIYRIETACGKTTEACDEHLWNVKINPKKSKGYEKTVTTLEIINELDKGHKVYLPLPKPTGLTKDIDLPVDPYLMGILISEGGLTNRSVSITTADQQIVDRIKDIVKQDDMVLHQNGNGITYRICNADLSIKRSDDGRFVRTNNLNTKLTSLGMKHISTYEKFIPEIYFSASINQRFELLRALMDGDGYIGESSTCEYSTSSEQLSKDVTRLVRSLGGIAKVSSRYPKYTHKGEKRVGALSYRIHIRFQDNSEIFFLTRKKVRAKERQKPIMNEIVSVEYVRNDKAQCITIDSEDHLYVTDDYIVTHNSYTGLMKFLKWCDEPEFVGYVFRLHATDLKKQGGAFWTAVKMFSSFRKGVTYTQQPMVIRFPSGATVSFLGMDDQAGRDAIQGIEISAAMCDEATHFNEEDIWWIVSRLRTNANMNPCIWLTCNPDPNSYILPWLKDFYLHQYGDIVDGEEVAGRPNEARNGKERYYLRVGNDILWGDTYDELFDAHQHKFGKHPITGESLCKPRTFVFIGATCFDNPEAMKKNPDYVANLASQPRVTMERLLKGSWFASEEESGYFKKFWIEQAGNVLNPRNKEDMSYLADVTKRTRAWDIAGTVPSEASPDPDFTVGVLIARTRDGRFIIEDVRRVRKRSGENLKYIISVAEEDRKRFGNALTTILPLDPAEAGKAIKLVRAKEFALKGIPVKFEKVGTKKSKLDKFTPFSAAAENGCVCVLSNNDWCDEWYKELERFDGISTRYHDDQVDATASAYNNLATTKEYKKLNPSLIG